MDEQAIISEVLKPKVLPAFEGNIPWPYLDTVGLVTTGVGHMIPDVDAMLKIPWFIVHTDTPATEDEVRAAWAVLIGEPQAMPASFYGPVTKIRLAPEWPMQDATDRLQNEYLPAVAEHVEGFDSFPLAAQAVFLDFQYNVKNFSHPDVFKHMKAAALQGNWQEAANQCHRVGLQQSRNDWAKAQLMSCENSHQGE